MVRTGSSNGPFPSQPRTPTVLPCQRDLEQLKSLLDQKIITQEEFDMRKAKLMAKWK